LSTRSAHGLLTINRPEKMNAMTNEMYAAIGDAERDANV
jgi:enoyl-CoA hydratase/carnithine racemase